MLKPKIPHTAVRYPRDEFELDAFRTAESFSAYYHKHTVLRYREEIDEIMSPHRGDFANETSQLEILKKLVWFKNAHVKNVDLADYEKGYSDSSYWARMAMGATLRLSQADLLATIRTWLQVENLDAVFNLRVLDMIGAVLGHNLNRMEWSSAAAGAAGAGGHRRG